MLLLFFVLAVSAVGCGSGGEDPVAAVDAPTSTVVDPVPEVDEFGIGDSSVFTEAFLPEITEDDVEVLEDDRGTSYRYVFPTRELSDGVVFDLEARWDPVDGGLQPSLTWNLTGDETSPTDFVFAASIPEAFAETVDDVVFDPEPTRIIEADPIVEWEFDATKPVTLSAISDALVALPRAGDDPSLIPLVIMATLNEHRIHSELSACSRFAPGASILISDARATGLMVQCYLGVVAVNASTFGGESCTKLGAMIGTWGDKPAFQYACRSVVQFATGGGATAGCDQAPTPSQRADCLSVMWGVLAGGCPVGDRVEAQICVYDAAVAVDDEQKCVYLSDLGSPEMANDCRAAITKDPSYCAKTEDPKLGASCCENFRGTDAYDTCLASIVEVDAGESTSTTTGEETTTTTGEEPTTTEAAVEDRPSAIPAGTYTGSFDEAHLVAVNDGDPMVRTVNTITVSIDDEGFVSGGFTLRQEGSIGGCFGWVDDYDGVFDAGQQIGLELPQVVIAAVHYSGQESLGDDLECLESPRSFSDHGSMRIELTRVGDGVLLGALDDFVYVPFKLQWTP